MSKIKNYDPDLNIQPEDKVIGTDANNSSRTKNYTFAQILNFLEYMGFGAVDGDLSHKEDKTNKVSTITGNETDEIKYPNTKAVADRVYAAIAESNDYTDIKTVNKADLVAGKVPQAQSQASSLSYNPVNGLMTFTDATGAVQAVDLPIENLFQSASYDSGTQMLTLTTNGGVEVDIDLNDLVDLPEIVVATSNPVVVPSTGQRLYMRSDTGALWIANGGAWNGPYLTVTSAEKNYWDAKADDANVLHKTGNEVKTSGTLSVVDGIKLPGLTAPSGKITSLGVDDLGVVTNIPNYNVSVTTPLNKDFLTYETATGLWKNKTVVSAQGDTGALTFAGLSTNTSTAINIGAVTGYVMDNETNPEVPSSVYVNYAGETAKTVTTIGSGTASYVMLSSTGVISFQNTFPTSAERKAKIWLGKVSHPAGAITLVVNEPDYITSPMSFSRDLFQVLGPYINDGVYPYPNGANLNINITSGNIHGDGINFAVNRTSPNEVSMGPSAVQAFTYRTQTGVGGAVTAVTPAVYDNAGTVTAIPGSSNQATIQYFRVLPGIGYVAQLGQTIYPTLAAAVAALGKETFTVYPSFIGNTMNIAALVVTKGCTSLSDTSTAQFFNANKNGEFYGASAGVSTATQQSAYDNSVPAEITTTAVNGAFTVKRGSASDSDSVYEGQNGAGTTTFAVKGTGDVTSNGEVTANGFILSGAGATDALIGNGDTMTITSGTFSPNVLDPVNVTLVVSPITGRYTRIGNIVTAYVGFQINVSATGSSASFTIALPISRATTDQIFMGTGSLMGSLNPHTAVTLESNSTSRVNVVFNKSASGTDSLFCSFTYQYSVLD
jgi:hypothetical protein